MYSYDDRRYIHLTPVHATPVHLTPVHLTPVHLTPVHLTPVHLIPCSSYIHDPFAIVNVKKRVNIFSNEHIIDVTSRIIQFVK